MRVTTREALWDVAVERYGYVTMRDAKQLGIDENAVWMLAARGGLEHAAHGVYRFPQLPVTERDPYMLAVLWTGTDEACLSHDTALAVYEACDINPDRIHLTVPTTRRIRRRAGERYEVHQQDLNPDQIGWWQGIPTVTLPAAIGQCVDSGVPGYLLRQALEHGQRTGDVLPQEVAALAAQLEARHDH
jgi:predicted transcriptional regulator of viral defense system